MADNNPPATLHMLIEKDFRHATARWDATSPELWLHGFARSCVTPRIRAVLVYRIAHQLWSVRWMRPLALYLQARSIRFSGAEIHPAARIGPGLLLVHSQGVVVGHTAVIGRDCAIYQGVTIGHATGDEQPVIGDRVRVFAGAKVLGGVHVGDDAWIGANAVVTSDVAASDRVGGIPARSLGSQGGV